MAIILISGVCTGSLTLGPPTPSDSVHVASVDTVSDTQEGERGAGSLCLSCPGGDWRSDLISKSLGFAASVRYLGHGSQAGAEDKKNAVPHMLANLSPSAPSLSPPINGLGTVTGPG